MPELATIYREITVTAEQLRTLKSAPVEILPSPGLGYFHAGRSLEYVATFNGTPFPATAVGGVYLAYGPNPTGEGVLLFCPIDGSTLAAEQTSVYVAWEGKSVGNYASLLDNRSIVLKAGLNASDFGGILTSHIIDGGLLYEAGDTFKDSNKEISDGACVGTVDTVDGSGTILTYHLTNPGNGYFPGDQFGVDALTGIGTGAVLDVDTITPNDGNTSLTLRLGFSVQPIAVS